MVLHNRSEDLPICAPCCRCEPAEPSGQVAGGRQRAAGSGPARPRRAHAPPGGPLPVPRGERRLFRHSSPARLPPQSATAPLAPLLLLMLACLSVCMSSEVARAQLCAGGLVGCHPRAPPQLPGGAAVPARPPVSQVPWRAGHCGACPSATSPAWPGGMQGPPLQLHAGVRYAQVFSYGCTQLPISLCCPRTTSAWIFVCMFKPLPTHREFASFARHLRRTWRQRSSCISSSATRRASRTRARMPARLPPTQAARRP